MTISTSEVVFSKAGVSVYNDFISNALNGEVKALRFALSDPSTWKPLTESFGELRSTSAYTAVTGTVFHTLNTEPGWSGTSLYRAEGGKMSSLVCTSL